MGPVFLRFPGGKSKHINKILPYFNDREEEYREPFVGGGSVYLSGVQFVNAWINDLDKGVYNLWFMVKNSPNVLISLIQQHGPILNHGRNIDKIKKSIELWSEIKNDVEGKTYPLGYRYLFLAKTCFSGLVESGPTGGYSQKGKYLINARWAEKSTIRKILQASVVLQDCKITNLSWEELVKAPGQDVALFLDPPYLYKGKQCYKHYFTLEDHKSLAKHVTNSGHRYVVTVDNCDELVEVWKCCGVDTKYMLSKEWGYSISAKREHNVIGKELFIVDERSLQIFKNKISHID